MNDRGFDDSGFEGGRSWEEFLRNLRREESDSVDDDRADEPEQPPGRDRPSASEVGDRDPQSARVVVPPETREFEGARRRRRRLLIGGAAALALLVGGFFIYDQVVAVGDPSDPAVATDSTRAPAEAEEASARFAVRAESLAGAIESFRERLRDFDLGRIGCQGLARGLQDVRSTFAGLREVAGEDGARVAAPARERFRDLAAEVRSVEDTFSESGCSGPP